MEKLKLGVIGMSEGNGHPYSWSAIFNGYDKNTMEGCPFPAILGYLSQQKFPDDSIPNATVDYIWTQDLKVSEHIAKASHISNVVDNITDMIGEVDAVLLARDDAEMHIKLASPFLSAGIPIYIDKPVALHNNDFSDLCSMQQYEGQVFSCSALRFASELKVGDIGHVKYIYASVPKSWKKYAVHVIDPIIHLIPNKGQLIDVSSKYHYSHVVDVKWKNTTATIVASELDSSPIVMHVIGEKGYQELKFVDAFNAFKSALSYFISIVQKQKQYNLWDDNHEIVRIIEQGL